MMKLLLTSLILLAFASASSSAQRARVARSPTDSRPPPLPTLVTNTGLLLAPPRHDAVAARAEAQKELAEHRSLVTPATYRELGLASVEEAGHWRAGEPLVFHRLSFDDLEDAVHGRTDRIRAEQRLWFPVEVNGATRAALVLEKSGKQWEGIRFGMASTAQRLAKLRQEIAARHGQHAQSFAVLELVPVRLLALAFTLEGKLMLVPTSAIPGTRTVGGEVRPAAELLAMIHPHWRQLKDDSAKTGRPVVR